MMPTGASAASKTTTPNRRPRRSLETVLDRLYGTRVGRGRSTSGRDALSKKQIGSAVREWFSSMRSLTAAGPCTNTFEPEQLHAERVLRQVVKTGAGSSRLVDARTLLALLDGDDGPAKATIPTASAPSGRPDEAAQLGWAGQVLSRDAAAGGRFRRWPCVFVGSQRSYPRSVQFLNGGWLVVDQSVRAGAEARKFVERGTESATVTVAGTADFASTDSISGTATNKTGRSDATMPHASSTVIRTQADRRIIQRLECLALGQVVPSQAPKPEAASAAEATRLEVDVREALATMNLPLTPQGAKEALLRVGWWTREINDKHTRVEPWSQPVVRSTRNDGFLLVRIGTIISHLK
jgi:hypothetical protein